MKQKLILVLIWRNVTYYQDFRKNSYQIIVCLCFSSEVLASIENVIQDIVVSLARNEAPVFTIDNRTSWENIKWAFFIFYF